MRWWWGVLILVLALVGGWLGGGLPLPLALSQIKPGAPAPPEGKAVVPALPKIPEVKPLPPATYEAKGRPDPFRSLAGRDSGESKGLTVASAKLVGVIQGRQGPLALVETPDGLGYIVKIGDVVGDGKVAEIGRDSVTFEVGRRGPVVLRLRTE